jgi:hypothetical protein
MRTAALWDILDALNSQTKFFDEVYLDSEAEMLYFDLCGSKTRNWITSEQRHALLSIIQDIDTYIKDKHGDDSLSVYNYIEV